MLSKNSKLERSVFARKFQLLINDSATSPTKAETTNGPPPTVVPDVIRVRLIISPYYMDILYVIG